MPPGMPPGMQRREINAVGQHGGRGGRRGDALHQPATQIVGHRDHARHAAQQHGALGGAAGLAHGLRVVVQEQHDARLRQQAGERQRGFRPVMHLDQRGAEFAQQPCHPGGMADIGVAGPPERWPRLAERNVGEGRPSLRPADNHGAISRRGGEPLHDQSNRAGAPGPETFARRQDDGDQGSGV